MCYVPWTGHEQGIVLPSSAFLPLPLYLASLKLNNRWWLSVARHASVTFLQLAIKLNFCVCSWGICGGGERIYLCYSKCLCLVSELISLSYTSGLCICCFAITVGEYLANKGEDRLDLTEPISSREGTQAPGLTPVCSNRRLLAHISAEQEAEVGMLELWIQAHGWCCLH